MRPGSLPHRAEPRRTREPDGHFVRRRTRAALPGMTDLTVDGSDGGCVTAVLPQPAEHVVRRATVNRSFFVVRCTSLELAEPVEPYALGALKAGPADRSDTEYNFFWLAKTRFRQANPGAEGRRRADMLGCRSVALEASALTDRTRQLQVDDGTGSLR